MAIPTPTRSRPDDASKTVARGAGIQHRLEWPARHSRGDIGHASAQLEFTGLSDFAHKRYAA